VSPSLFAQPQSLLDHFGAVLDSRRRAGMCGVFAAAGAFTTSPQKGFPVVAMLVALDPGVDRAGRHAAAGVVGILAPAGARDLLRRTLVCQAVADGCVQLRFVELTRQRPLTASLLSQVVGLSREVLTADAIPPQLPADRGGVAVQLFCNLLLKIPAMMQLRYAITFFLRKMGHRWDSVPKRCFQHTHPLETPSDTFQNPTLSHGSIAFQISDRP
jgi:hypothetical protein